MSIPSTSTPDTNAPREPITEVHRGARRVGYSTVVAAPAQELYAMLANPHRHHEADGSGSVKPDVIGPRELQPGDRFRVSMKMKGIPYAITSRVVDLQPDRVVEWQHPGKHTWRWEFEPVDDGRTRVTEIFDYSRSPIGALLDRTAADANRQGIQDSLRKLQQRYGA